MAQECLSRAHLHRSNLTTVCVPCIITFLSSEQVQLMLVYEEVESVESVL